MKIILIDYTNFGVLYTSDYTGNNKVRWDFEILKNCILDTHVTFINKQNFYDEINQSSIKTNLFKERQGIISRGNTYEINDLFKSKQRKAEMIYPLIQKLTHAVASKCLKYAPYFYVPIEDTIGFELMTSNPENNIFSTGIRQYASILDISNEEAYQELLLTNQSINAIKMKAYATVKKYERMIRSVETQQQADEVMLNIEQKLIRETFI
jgi:hypothetical protein